MSRGLRPVTDAIRFDGCPFCGEHPVGVQIDGPEEIILDCGHVLDVKAWADGAYLTE